MAALFERLHEKLARTLLHKQEEEFVLSLLAILQGIEHVRKKLYSAGIIAQEVGFLNGSYFCRVFKTVLGITPKTYRLQPATQAVKGYSTQVKAGHLPIRLS